MVPVYAFSLLLGTGAALGLGWLVANMPARSLPAVAAGLFALFGALLGARMGYLTVNWAYFRTHAAEILQLPWGGLSWGGALAGGALALAVALLILRLSPFHILDSLFPLVALLSVATWLGCWLDGCAYGPVSSRWDMLLARDEWGNLSGRIPVQLFGVTAGLLTLLLFDLARRWLRVPGLAGILALAALAMQTLWLSGLRVDPAPHWLGARLDLWAARAFTVSSILFLAAWLAAHRGVQRAGDGLTQ
jgi:prolipoprotein diacylglyceryltransferase